MTTITTTLTWRLDAWGRHERDLYAGNIYVGSIQDETGLLRKPEGRDPFRIWLMTSDEGDIAGYYPTEPGARAALEEKAKEALSNG